MGSVVTPRRAYFSEDDVVAPFSDSQLPQEDEEEGETVDEADDIGVSERESLVPPTPSTVVFLQREDYKDQGILSGKTILIAFGLALLLLVILASMGREPPVEREASLDESTLAAPEPSIPPQLYLPDWAAQCHKFYSFDSTPVKHSHDFFENGAHDFDVLQEWGVEQSEGTCHRSLTYFLDSDFGLFYHLTAISQAYSFAKVSNRSFFIDDTNWDRGKWADHFQAMPDPGCERPPVERLHACPRGSRHWAMDSQTLMYHFGHQYQEAFENPKAVGIQRRKPMFELSRRAFEELLVPSDHVAKLIRTARQELYHLTLDAGNPGLYVGVHVRRGDRHPRNWFDRLTYVSLDKFATEVLSTWDQRQLVGSPVIHLASAASPSLTSSFPRTFVYSVDTSLTLELNSLALKKDYTQTHFAELGYEERVLQTRGALVDFDLLVGGWHLPTTEDEDEEMQTVPIAVICTISSNICKFAAVAMGWESAFVRGRWINLDGREMFEWTPTEIP